MIKKVPAPEVVGENVPAVPLVMPVPVHVPPVVAAVRLNEEPFTHTALGALIVASGVLITVITTVSAPPQGPGSA